MKKKILTIILSVFMVATSLTVNIFAEGEELTVTYDKNIGPGGSYSGDVPVDSNKYDLNATVTVLGNTGNLQRDDYNFVGWNTKYDGTGDRYSEGNTFSISDHTILYAEWEEKPYIKIQISNKNDSNGIVKVKFDTDIDFAEYTESDKDGSGNVKAIIPDNAETVTFVVVPGNGFALRDSNLYIGDTEQKDLIDNFENKLLSTSGLTIDISEGDAIAIRTDFGLPHPTWKTVSWGGGNVQVENGEVYAHAIHIGENTYTEDEEAYNDDPGDKIYPISDLIQTNDDGETIMRTKGATLGETDLFVWDECYEDVSIDFRFIPEYGYQVTNIVLNENLEESLLENFEAEEEVSSFSFDFSKESNVHFIVMFTSTDDTINSDESEAVTEAFIENGFNATDSGNLLMNISDVDSNTVAGDFKEEVRDDEAVYLNMELYQTVSKAVEDSSWKTQLTELDDDITLTLNMPELDPNSQYCVIREHNGAYEEIDDVVYNPEEQTITFDTDKFSTYAIAKDPLEDNEFTVEYDERRNDEGDYGFVKIDGEETRSGEQKTFEINNSITFVLNPPADRKTDVPIVEIEVFDGDESIGKGNTIWATYIPEGEENRIELDENSFTFEPTLNNSFVVRVMWSAYDWFGPEDGEYLIETNIFGNGSIVPSIENNGHCISRGDNQNKDCYDIGDDVTLSFVPEEGYELEFVAFGYDVYTKDEEDSLPLSNLWNEEENCYQITIENANEHDSYYVEAHFVGNETYEVIRGSKRIINVYEDKDVLFVSNADYDKFVEIRVDGEVVDNSNYTVKEGSTKVIMKASYLRTLRNGRHTLEIVSTDGIASTTFTIVRKITPTPKPEDRPAYTVPNTGIK